MSTNSTISIQHKDGTIEQIYCHYDGYLSHNGKILLDFYTDRSKVEELIKLGGLSVLAPEIGEQPTKVCRLVSERYHNNYGSTISTGYCKTTSIKHSRIF